MLSAVLLCLLCTGGYAYDETYEKAVKHFKAREYQKAVPYLETYVDRMPDPAGYYMLGYALYKLSDYERSREYFDQAYLIDPEFTSEKIPAHAGLADEDERLIHDILALSGAGGQIEFYADIVRSSIPVVGETMIRERTKLGMLELVGGMFRQERLYPSLVSSFNSRFDHDHSAAVIRWLKSPLGRKIAALESRPHTPAGIQRSMDMYQKLPDGRRQIIGNLETALRLADTNIDIVSHALSEMLKGMQAQLGEHSTMTLSEIDACLVNAREMPREEITKYALDSLAHMYQGLTDEEVRAAARFYAAPAGTWFTETRRYAFRTALGKVSRDSGEKLGQALALKRLGV